VLGVRHICQSNTRDRVLYTAQINGLGIVGIESLDQFLGTPAIDTFDKAACLEQETAPWIMHVNKRNVARRWKTAVIPRPQVAL
jgi:hypothetical protein